MKRHTYYPLKLFLVCLACLCLDVLHAQLDTLPGAIYSAHQQFRAPEIESRRFKHQDIQPIIGKLKSHPDFTVQMVGKSIEGREISLVSYGNGPISILLWSQMHGNEATATMALMDIFNLLATDGSFDELKAFLKEKVSLHFIPMLNPDGAEKFQRRNAMGVDLNRDALRLTNPEARILKRIRDSLSADWGFNLHDQSRYYSAGNQPKTAAISFLAPAFNEAKDLNENRKRSMQLIGIMNEAIQTYIPGHVGKYNDTFEPRAFGDNIQKWGTSTILIETGGLPGDREKQELRRINFLALMVAFVRIADQSYQQATIDPYEQIPFNRSNKFHDIILRNANFKHNNQNYLLDIAFRQEELDHPGHRTYDLNGYISDLGHLSTAFGYQELDATSLNVSLGNTYPNFIKKSRQLGQIDPLTLLEEGFTQIMVDEKLETPDLFPLKVIKAKAFYTDQINSNKRLHPGQNPTILLNQGNSLKYVIANGALYRVNQGRLVQQNPAIKKASKLE